MYFRNYIPPDGGHAGCGIWQTLAPQNDNYLNSYHEPLRKRVNSQCKFSDCFCPPVN